MPSDYDRYVDDLVAHYCHRPQDWVLGATDPRTGWRLATRIANGPGVTILAPPDWYTYRETVGKVLGVKKTVYTGSQNYGTDIILGEEYRDELSGFTGKAVGLYFFISGCERVELETFDEKRKELKSAVFDAGRLVNTVTGRTATQQAPGGPHHRSSMQPTPGMTR